MYDILKAIAAANGWVFDYGRSDYHNLFDGTENKNQINLFLDPVKIKKNTNDSGVVESRTYSGSFMMLLSSDIDELSYDDRYNQYIKPLIEGELDLIEDSMRCEHEASFELWEITEVINMFDYNFDGIICTYQITIDE